MRDSAGRMIRLRRVVGTLALGAIGFAMVLGSLVMINRSPPQVENENRTTSIDFTVPPAPPEPPPPEPEQQQRPRERTDRPPVAPAPSLGGSLSGIAVDVPGFEVAGVESVEESLLGDLDNVALTEDAVDSKPVPREKPIQYPDRARQRRIEGRVVVSVLIDTDGNVQTVRILEADPPNVFNEMVLNSVPNWKFEPAKYKGEPVQTWARIPIPFRLN